MSTIKQWLVRFGQWLVYTFSEPIEEDSLTILARKLTIRMNDNWPLTDGEFKRAKVYAQLINTFPNRSRREVSRAIEEALACGE